MKNYYFNKVSQSLEKIALVIILLLIFGFSEQYLNAQVFDENDGSSIINTSIKSTILNRNQYLQIYLPKNYSNSSKNFPVLYILDGQYYFYYGVAFQQTSKWRNKSPEYIVVGIKTENKQLRRLDFGSDEKFRKYLNFIEKELIPNIENNYKTSSDRIIFGWQYAGYSVFQALFERPHLFNAYLSASSASADTVLFNKFKKRELNKEKFLYFTYSPSETWLTKDFNSSKKLFQNNKLENFRWSSETFPQEDHWSTPYRTIYRGLTEYYRDYQPLKFKSLEEYENSGGIKNLKNHYEIRGKKYNVSPEIHHSTVFNLLSLSMRADDIEYFELFMNYFTGEITGLFPSRWHNRYGQFYLRHGKLEKASTFYNNSLQVMPESYQLLAGLGDVLIELGKKEKAIESYQQAVKFAEFFEEPDLDNLKEKLSRLESMD